MPPEKQRKIGVFGGTFDPVHLGHLIVAEQVREQGQLDEVWFVPAGQPPHKREQPLTPFARRVEMLQLAIAGHPAFRIEELEGQRPGPSFTVDTLTEIARRHPDVDWHLLLGSDSLVDLPQWYQPRRIVELAGLLIVPRPQYPLLAVEQLQAGLGLPPDSALRLQVIDVPPVGISSSDIRRRVGEGRSIRYLVPRAVECYIQEKGIYRQE